MPEQVLQRGGAPRLLRAFRRRLRGARGANARRNGEHVRPDTTEDTLERSVLRREGAVGGGRIEHPDEQDRDVLQEAALAQDERERDRVPDQGEIRRQQQTVI